MTLSSLEPGSAVGKKAKNGVKEGKYRRVTRDEQYPTLIFAPFSHNAEPGLKLDINILLDFIQHTFSSKVDLLTHGITYLVLVVGLKSHKSFKYRKRS